MTETGFSLQNIVFIIKLGRWIMYRKFCHFNVAPSSQTFRFYSRILIFLLQEVEADKQNAAKLNALVQITSPAEDWPIGGRPPHSDGISRGRRSEQDRSQQSNSNSSTANCHTFGEVRKKQPGCVRHRAVVGFMYKRYPAWLILIHLHGR
jgi:hypothetical protein